MLRMMRHGFLFGPALRDIGKNTDAIDHFALRILERIDRKLFQIGHAILAAIPQLPFPMPGFNQCLPHVGIELTSLLARFQQARVLPEHFFARVSGQNGKGGIDVNDIVVRIHDHDAFIADG